MDPSFVSNKPDFMEDSAALANEDKRNAAIAAATKASDADSEADNINTKNYNSNVAALDKFAISRDPSDLGSIADKYSNVVKAAKAVDDAKTLQKGLIDDVKKQTNEVKRLNDQLKITDRRSQAFKNKQKQLQTAKMKLESVKKTAIDAADKVAETERTLKGNIEYAKINEEREKNAKNRAAESAAIQAAAAGTARKEIADNGLLDPIRTEAGVEQKRLKSLAFASKRSRRKSS